MEDWDNFSEEESIDGYEIEAYDVVKKFFTENKEKVFYGRQLEVLHEDRFFHWVTSRVLRALVADGVIVREKRMLEWGGSITLYWYKTFRYYRREASSIVGIVEEFSKDEITRALGDHAELLVNEIFSRFDFANKGRDKNEFNGKKWTTTGHNLDFIFEKDRICYGVEIKNTLGYIEKDEFYLKIDLCKYLGLVPLFIVRMLPKTWINDLVQVGGYALIMKYQLYPSYFSPLVKHIKETLGLPVDSPRRLLDGTVQRFDKWHKKHVNS